MSITNLFAYSYRENMMIKTLIKHLGVCILAIILYGCGGFLNEGATRVRVSTTDTTSTSAFDSIYFKPSTLYNITIKQGEHFSISLLSAHICGFRESRGLDAFTIDGSNPTNSDGEKTVSGCTYGGLIFPTSKDRTTRGEISIVANVAESSASKSNNINPANSKGRVIYYNDDVRESGQLINAINLPIYGPKEYGGKNIVFDLWMLELDNEENNQLKSLLGSLAALGGKSYPPSAAILGVLNTLGSAFLNGNQDDVEARFQMRFDVPAHEKSTVARLPLAEGYYAFVREENRDLTPEWSSFAVDEKQGVLCNSEDGKVCSGNDQNAYRDRTWFLVRVARETREAALDIEYGEEVGLFLGRLDALEAADMKRVTDETTKLADSLKSLVCGRVSDVKKAKLKLNCPEETSEVK